MRILRINIRNLNSLRGEHRIDFTTSPLADHPLYAIVGATGAGKTTILDAITLALYGQTERNKSEVDSDPGTVLTFGEGECLAELDYETANGRFRSAWTRQRAHKKPDGNLTASKHSISQFNEQTGEWDILATKKREVAEKTQEVVGLDYERFVRSVMLTQGDFARFLKSDTGNKAEILEKITGTEIYRDLSVAAFTKAKLAREAHERAVQELESAPPLATEDRQRLNEQLVQQKTEVASLKKALATVVQQLSLHDNLRALQSKETTAKAELDRLEKAWAETAADRDRLAKSEALQPLRTDLEAELRLESATKKGTADLAATEQQSQALKAALEAATKAITIAQDKVNDYYEKLPAREKKFAAVAELEREITALLKDVDLDQKRHASLEESLKERQVKQSELTRAIASIRKELAGMEPALIRQRLEALEVSIPLAGTEREQLELRLNRRRTEDRLTAEKAGAEKAEVALKTATASLEQAGKAFATAEVALSDRQLMLTNLRLSASLSEHKHNLKPGEECPVCGAVEHPALKDFKPVTESSIERTQADLDRAQAEVTARHQALSQVRREEVELRRRYDGHQALVVELTTQLGPAKPEPETVEVLADKVKSLVDRIQQETAEQSRLRGLQTKLPKLIALETELTTVSTRVGELTTEREAVAATLETANKAVGKKREKIKSEVGDRTAEQCRELTRKKKDELTAALAAAEKAEVDQRGQLAALASRQAVIQEQLEKQSKELAAVRERLSVGLADKECSATQARQTLLPESEALHLRARLNELTTERATATTVSQRLAAELEEAAKQTIELPVRDDLDKEKAQREFAVSEADRLIGAIELQVKQDDQRIADTAEKRTQIEGLRKETDRWAVMNKLIGSADGKKFRSYAQAITLQRLIEIGNAHLASISPRYRMEYAPPTSGNENLEMIIVDTYHDEHRRTMATLSGGETFLISLALALGLSDLASGKNLIQSLFIDEGFGTLDGKTLDQAMTTLEQLRARGKMIGLISHVPSLRERIQCQIRLEPVGDGFSRVEVVG